MLIIQKFGGSSLADRNKILTAASRIAAEKQQGNDVLVVVSAMGDTTDDLLELAKSLGGGEGRELAALMSSGEQQSAALMATALIGMGLPARSFTGWQAGILTHGELTDADIALIAPLRLESALHGGIIPVVAGFQGMTASGDISTLGRGGSDTTAVALAAALMAEGCVIFTDVDGIYTADPRLVPSARKLSVIDYTDMLRLSGAGSQVLHGKCVDLAMREGVKIELCGTEASSEGTLVCSVPLELRQTVAGITRDYAGGTLTAVGRGADRLLMERVDAVLRENGIITRDRHSELGFFVLSMPPEALTRALVLAHGVIFR